MPAGKYSFYLHTDDRTDMLVSATLETISQPLRGDFLRTATTAGGVLYRIDTRLPALITELFDGKLYAVQLTCLIGALNGLLPASPAAEVREALPARRWAETNSEEPDERRRITLQLPETNATVSMIESAPSRLRGQLLRQLITTGCALHTLDVRLPQLLTNLPAPPGTLNALMSLLNDITGGAAGTLAPAADKHTEAVRADVPVADAGEDARIRNNMKKLF